LGEQLLVDAEGLLAAHARIAVAVEHAAVAREDVDVAAEGEVAAQQFLGAGEVVVLLRLIGLGEQRGGVPLHLGAMNEMHRRAKDERAAGEPEDELPVDLSLHERLVDREFGPLIHYTVRNEIPPSASRLSTFAQPTGFLRRVRNQRAGK